jgi:heat shock protein HspQ
MRINLGDLVSHKINGYEGVVTGVAQYMGADNQVLVSQEKLTDDNKLPESHWIDEGMLSMLKEKHLEIDDFAATSRPKGR